MLEKIMSGIELRGLKGLKGLESLLEDNKEHRSEDVIHFLPINKLSPGIFQPRTVFNDENLQSLISSIKENGIIQPLIVREKKENSYEIIAGERRWRAAKLADLNEIPVLIRNVSDDIAAVFALVENIQREDLNPIDQAVALSRLVSQYDMTHEQVSKIVGISRPSVTNLIRLLSLAENIQKLLMEKKIETGHAKAIFSLEANHQIMIAKKIIEKKLSVREVENLVKKIKFSSIKIESTNLDEENEIKEWNRKLMEKIYREVNVFFNKNGKGKIEIKFNTKEEARWLINHLRIE
jgi:ParB family chromosome partitioning protein